MLCRALLAAIAISYLICVLVLSGMQKEDLDVNMLTKLQNRNINMEVLNNDKLREECLTNSSVVVKNAKERKERDTNENQTTEVSQTILNYSRTKEKQELLNEDGILNYLYKNMKTTEIPIPESTHITEKVFLSIQVNNTQENNNSGRYIPNDDEISTKSLITTSTSYTPIIKYSNGEEPNLNNVMKFWNKYINRRRKILEGTSKPPITYSTLDLKPTQMTEASTTYKIFRNKLESSTTVSHNIAGFLSEYMKNTPKSITKRAFEQKDKLNHVSEILNKLLKIQSLNDTGVSEVLSKKEDVTLNAEVKPNAVTLDDINYRNSDFQVSISDITNGFNRSEKSNIQKGASGNGGNNNSTLITDLESEASYMIYTQPTLSKETGYDSVQKIVQEESLKKTNKHYLKPEERKSIQSNNTENESQSINSMKILTPDIIKQIAETVKAIVLKDLQKQIPTTTTTTTTTLTTPVTETPLHKADQNKLQRATQAIERFIELLEQMKPVKEKIVMISAETKYGISASKERPIPSPTSIKIIPDREKKMFPVIMMPRTQDNVDDVNIPVHLMPKPRRNIPPYNGPLNGVPELGKRQNILPDQGNTALENEYSLRKEPINVHTAPTQKAIYDITSRERNKIRQYDINQSNIPEHTQKIDLALHVMAENFKNESKNETSQGFIHEQRYRMPRDNIPPNIYSGSLHKILENSAPLAIKFEQLDVKPSHESLLNDFPNMNKMSGYLTPLPIYSETTRNLPRYILHSNISDTANGMPKHETLSNIMPAQEMISNVSSEHINYLPEYSLQQEASQTNTKSEFKTTHEQVNRTPNMNIAFNINSEYDNIMPRYFPESNMVNSQINKSSENNLKQIPLSYEVNKMPQHHIKSMLDQFKQIPEHVKQNMDNIQMSKMKEYDIHSNIYSSPVNKISEYSVKKDKLPDQQNKLSEYLLTNTVKGLKTNIKDDILPSNEHKHQMARYALQSQDTAPQELGRKLEYISHIQTKGQRIKTEDEPPNIPHNFIFPKAMADISKAMSEFVISPKFTSDLSHNKPGYTNLDMMSQFRQNVPENQALNNGMLSGPHPPIFLPLVTYGVGNPPTKMAPLVVHHYNNQPLAPQQPRILSSYKPNTINIITPRNRTPVININQLRPTPIMIQTSKEIPPLGVPISMPVLINRNIVLSTLPPFIMNMDKRNRQRWDYMLKYGRNPDNQDEIKERKNRLAAYTNDPLTRHISYKHEYAKVNEPNYISNNDNSQKYELKMSDTYDRMHTNLQRQPPVKQHLSKPKKKIHDIKGFHEKLENTGELLDDKWPYDEQTDIDYSQAKVVSRQQLPLTEMKRGSKFDDTHFKNFLKTQQKVNDMLEKILATRTKHEHQPRSVETT